MKAFLPKVFGGIILSVFASLFFSPVSAKYNNDRNKGISTIKNETKPFNSNKSVTGKHVAANQMVGNANALNFDGVNDYVSIANPFRAFGKELTVEFWFNPSTPNLPFGSIIGQSTADVDNMATNVWLMHPETDGRMIFYVNDGGTWRAAPAINLQANSWHHIAGVASASGVKIYVDGVQQGATNPGISGTIMNNSASVIHIGKDVRWANSRFGNESIDEVRVWSRALCQSEILNNMNCELVNPTSQSGLQEYYSFNQGVAAANNAGVTTLSDLSGNGRDGNLNAFALSGSTSNWVAGTVTGNCTVFTPLVAPITGTFSSCIGSTTQLANTNVGVWSSSNTAVATISSTGLVTAVSAGTVTISFTSECGAVSTQSFTVNATNSMTLTSGAGTNNQTVCINTPITNITYSSTGATGFSLFGQPNGIAITALNGVVTLSGTTTFAGTFTYNISQTSGCGVSAVTGTIVVKQNNVKPTSILANVSSLCQGKSAILTQTGGTLGTGATWKWYSDAGYTTLVGTSVSANAALVVSPTSTTTYYLRSEGVVSPCSPAILAATGGVTITVNPAPGAPTAPSVTDCNTGIFNLSASGGSTPDYLWFDDVTAGNVMATTAAFTTKPLTQTTTYYVSDYTASNELSLNAALSTNQFCSAGTASNSAMAFDVANTNSNNLLITAVSTTFNTANAAQPIQVYYRTSTYSGNDASATGWVLLYSGTINVTAARTPIKINFTNPLYLPAGKKYGFYVYSPGISQRALNGANTYTGTDITITGGDLICDAYSGPLTGGVNTARSLAGAVYYKNITCESPRTATQAIITAANTINLSSAVGTNNQTICNNTSIANITYATTGATGASFSGLPTGVTGSWSANVVTISGTATVAGVYNYTVTLTGGCSIKTATGTITVNPIPTANVSVVGNTSACLGSTVSLQANTGTGYTYQWYQNNIAIAEATASTYNAPSTGSYTVVITGTGGCASPISNAIAVTVADEIAPVFTSTASNVTATATGSNGSIVNFSLPTATDNCTINPTVTAVPASGSLFPIGTTLVTVTATDATGNYVNTAFNVVVAGVAPELVVPADFDVNTTVGACTAIVNFAVTETTGIPASTITYTEYGIPTYSGYMNDVGTHTITATATNAIGSASKTFTFTVHDVTPPQFTSTATILTANVGGAVQATSLAGAVVNFTLPAATDNCANAYVTAVPYSGSVFPLGENTVVVTATDPSGNTSQTTFTVTVVGVAPSIVVPSTITVNNKAGLCNAIVNFAATDPTGVPASTITYDIQPGSVFNVGTTKVTATATNELGSSSLSFDVVVKDSELPKVFTKDPTIYLDANGQATLTVAQVDNGSTDNCAIANKTISKTLFNCSDLVKAVPNASALKFNGSGIAYIPSLIPGGNNFSFSSWFYANDAGNGKIISSGAFEICLCGNSIQVYTPNGGSFGAQGISLNRWHNIIVTYSFPLAKVYVDGILSFSFNAGPIGGISGAALGRHVNGCCPLIGTLDEMSFWNITLSASQIAAMQTKALKGDEAGLTAYYNFDEATGTTINDRSGNHHNAIMQSMLNPWTTVAAPITTSASNTVILSVTDASGNIATGTAVVTVLDAIAPTITAPANMNVFATSASGATVTYTEPVGTDNCSATTTRIAGLASGSVFPIGTTTVTYSAVDLSGNKTDCSFTVTVSGIAPSIVKPADISVASPLGECGANVNFAATETTGIPASVITYTVDGSEVVSGANFSVGVHTITATATNAIGSTSVDFTITVLDDQLPTITAPADITINNTEGRCGAIDVALGSPTVADNCAVADYYPDYHYEFPVGTTEVTWTVVDGSGNFATAIQHVTVIDNEKPFIRKAFDWGREGGTAEPGKCGTSNIASLHLGVPGTASTFTVSDNCEIASITSNAPTFFPVGVTIVTYTVTDIHGNFSTIDEEVTVSDFEPPVIAAVDNITVNATGAAGAVVNYTAPVGTDNCSAATTVMTAGLVSGSTFPIGTTVVTYTVTDATGLTASTSFNVTVIGIAPEIVAPNNYLVNSEAGKCGASVNFAATETRAIPASTITYTENGSAIVSGAYFTVGTHTITATATNAVGSSSVDFTITVVDHQAPIAKAKNITVGLGTQVGGLVTITAAQVDNGSTDACGIASMTVVPASFGCSKVGANTVTLTVTDVNGNSSTTTAVVTIVDDKGPVPTVTTLPTITGQCYATALTLKPGEKHEDHEGDDDDNNKIEMDHYYLVAPTAMDNCSGLAKGTTTDPLTYYNQGTYIIHWKYVDAKGNVTIQEQTVIVKDTQAPTPKRSTLPTITGQCSVIVNGSNDKDHDDDDDEDREEHHSNTPWAKDNCSGWIKGTTTDPLTYTVQGTYTITWSFNDGHGNVSTQTQTVIVKDVTKPRINAPKDKTISCGSNILPATTGMATATDNCTATPVITYTDVNTNNLITRTWTATDAAGNSSTDVQLIKLTPAFTAVAKSTPTSTVYTGGSTTNIYLGYGAQSTTLSVTGLPAGSYTYTWTGSNLNNSNSATPVFTATTAGVTTFYVTVTNANGCSSTASISICVTDVRVPGSNGALIYVCHQGSSKTGGTQTLSVPVAQVAAHLANSCGSKGNDKLGSCSSTACTTNTEHSAVDPKSGDAIEIQPLKSDVAATTPAEDIKVIVMPNPSTTYFTLKFETKDQKTALSLRVMDASGRAIDSKQQIEPSNTIQIGHNYPSGTFFAEVIQGNKRKTVQLIKAKG